MNSLKTLRLMVAIVMLIQGNFAPALTRNIATQNVDVEQRFDSRDEAPLASPAALGAAPQPVVEAAIATQKAPVGDWVENLPGDEMKYYARVFAYLKSIKVPLDNLDAYTKRISKYLAFIMYNSKKPITEQEKILFGEKGSGGVLGRLTQSSTEFLFCANPNDFECIEQVPRITPTAKHRVEDPTLKLGKLKIVPDSFNDKMEVHFNEQLLVHEDLYTPATGVARKLEDLINEVKPGKDNGIFMSLYGIDDIRVVQDEVGSKKASMKGVYDAIVNQHKNNVLVQGVFDTVAIHKNVPKGIKLIFSYQKPKDKEELARWIFSPLKNPMIDKDTKRPIAGHTNMRFMYNVGTQNLVNELNSGAKSFSDTKARFEKPDAKIMHNKFFVTQNNGKMAVWTGTTNIARTCLGTERNSNLSVIIREKNIAQVYKDEFTEMHDLKTEEPKVNSKFDGIGKKTFPIGKFKKDKTPNTHRLFKFAEDNTFVRVYFSPTDDGEHRAVLPMLHSALPGDKIIISMFCATGIEYVRAIQWAAARGVDVQIIVDSPTACGLNAWAGLGGQSSLLEDNLFADLFKGAMKDVSMSFNNKGRGEIWKQNHQKIGMLLRKQPNGKLVAEHFLFGSQNWSEGGNDGSDENMMAISRVNNSLPIGDKFLEHFNWLLNEGKAIPMIKAGCRASTKAYKLAHPEEDLVEEDASEETEDDSSDEE